MAAPDGFVDFGSASGGETTKPEVREGLKEIHILTCHENDFLAHPRWWAMMQKPEVEIGETFYFVFPSGHKRLVRCQGLKRPGETMYVGQNQSLMDRFMDWWVLTYLEL